MLAPAALGVLVATLSALRLGDRGIWLDEGVSAFYASGSWWHLQKDIAHDPNMSLYYELLWFWRRIAGDSEVALRSLSLVCAVVGVVLVYALGTRLFNARAGTLAALLLAINPFYLRYAQEARGYSLVAMLVTTSSLFFVAAVQQPRLMYRVGYVVSSAAAFYAHFFAAFVVGAQGLVLLAQGGRLRRDGRAWIACYLAILVLVSPIAACALTLGRNPIGWIARPSWDELVNTIRAFAGGTFTLVGGVLAAYALASFRWLQHRRRDFASYLLGAWLVLPVGLSLAISQVHPIFVDKYLIVSLPAFAIATGAVLATLRPQPAGFAVLVALLLLAANPLLDWYRRPALEDWKGAATYLLARSRPGDGIVYNRTYSAEPMGYYLRRGRAPHLAELARDRRLPRLASTDVRRIWLVLYLPDPGPAALDSYLRDHRYTRVSSHRFSAFGGISVELYARRQRT